MFSRLRTQTTTRWYLDGCLVATEDETGLQFREPLQGTRLEAAALLLLLRRIGPALQLKSETSVVDVVASCEEYIDSSSIPF